MNTSDAERTLFNFLDQNRLLNLGLEYYIADNADELKQEYKIICLSPLRSCSI